MGGRGTKSNTIGLFNRGGMSTKEASHDDLPYRVTIEDDSGSGGCNASSVETDKLKKAEVRAQGEKTCNEAAHHPVRPGRLSGREYS